ncbi:hypothetical protein GF407_07710 [candidate division KSB1 bacterium]|nr:hypothetical protein [candidate division KSB1 bacterium]
MKSLWILLICICFQSLFGQFIVKNTSGELMHVNSDGYFGFRTTDLRGLISVDSLGGPYSYFNMHGDPVYGQSSLFIDVKENIDYNTAIKNVGIHTFVSADATPSALTEARQNIAISAQLYNPGRTKTIGVANLAENWSLGPADPTRRDITMVKGSLQNADEMVMGADIRRISAVEGSVKSLYNTLDPDVVFAGYFSGAKSYFDGPVYIGRQSQSAGEIGDPQLNIYAMETETSAKLRLRGEGDGVRYANIQLARTQDEEKWIMHYRDADHHEDQQDLVFSFYSSSNPGNGYEVITNFEHDTGYLKLYKGGTLLPPINTPDPVTIPTNHILVYVNSNGDLVAMNAAGSTITLADF